MCSREASRYLVEVLESVSASELDDVIEQVLDAVERQPRKNKADRPLLARLHVFTIMGFFNSVVQYDRTACGGERCAGLHPEL